MLQAQVNYWTLVENRRHNLAGEELERFKNEETKRHNVQSEYATMYGAVETKRHNQVEEGIGKGQLDVNRNLAISSEQQAQAAMMNARTNQGNLEVNRRNAETQRYSAEQNAGIGWMNAGTNSRNASTSAFAASTGRQQLDIQRGELAVKQQQANTAETRRIQDAYFSTIGAGVDVVNTALGGYTSIGNMKANQTKAEAQWQTMLNETF